MARINVRPSYASSSRRPSHTGSQLTPGPGDTSDQENHDPNLVRMDKGKGRATDPPLSRASLPTPGSSDSNEARGQKRKRVEVRRSAPQASEDESSDDDDSDARHEKHFRRHFDPDQDVEKRTEIRKKSRALEREVQENRDDLLRDNGNGLTRTINKANEVFKDVRQTNDATTDSRLLVNLSDLAYKKSAQLVLGDTSTGIDVDEFLSKCITFMRSREGEEDAPSTSRRRGARNADHSDAEDDDDIIGAPLDWAFLGKHACFPYNSRPCVPHFLLGPLSVEKKQRTQTQRRARQKDTAGREARPEALTREDLHQSDENGLTAICKRINKHLSQHVEQATRSLEHAGFESQEDLKSERGRAFLKQHRISDSGGPSLFDFVLNPRSFGQTVENLFYVSFLIKEGSFGIQNDSDGLPTIIPSQASTLEQQRASKSSKHQAVFSIDYGTWQRLIEAFDVKDPLIAHREEDEGQQAVGERGWYT